MNPNELRPGDRIMIPAREVEVIKTEPTNYTGIWPVQFKSHDGSKEWLHIDIIRSAHLITPDKPVADKWEPKVGEWVIINNTEDNLPEKDNRVKFIGRSSKTRTIVGEIEDGGLRYGIHVKPIPSAPAMEDGLSQILTYTNNWDIKDKILAWHTKHQPSIPSAEEFSKYYWDGNTIRDTYAHFGMDKIARGEVKNG